MKMLTAMALAATMIQAVTPASAEEIRSKDVIRISGPVLACQDFDDLEWTFAHLGADRMRRADAAFKHDLFPVGGDQVVSRRAANGIVADISINKCDIRDINNLAMIRKVDPYNYDPLKGRRPMINLCVYYGFLVGDGCTWIIVDEHAVSKFVSK